MKNEPIILSGTIYGYGNSAYPLLPCRGDCKVLRPSSKVGYVRASIFDGEQWRKLYLSKPVGQSQFEYEMRDAVSLIKARAGKVVYWGLPYVGAKNGAYVI